MRGLACCSARQGGEYLFVYVFCENAVCVIGKKPARPINDEELLLLQPCSTCSDLICLLCSDEANTLIFMILNLNTIYSLYQSSHLFIQIY